MTMPVFVIKAKDLLAPEAVAAYRDLCIIYGLREQAAEVNKAIEEIAAWQEANVDVVKLPDHTHVAADAVRADVLLPDGEHRYWSTHCRHDGHDACSSEEHAPGVPRRPAQCKTCAAPCRCTCHVPADGAP